jgi:hypothetical protein
MLRCCQNQIAKWRLIPNTEQRLSLMYNPLGPWDAWLALSSEAARVYWATQSGMLRGIANGATKAEIETDRVVTENVGAAEAQIPAAARKSNKKHPVARKAVTVPGKRDRRNRQVRSGRVDHRAKKIQKSRAA